MNLNVGDKVEVLSGNPEQAHLIGKIGTVDCIDNSDQIGIDLDEYNFFYPPELKKVTENGS